MDSRGLLQHPENIPDCSLSHVQPTFAENFKENPLISILLTDTDSPENVEKDSLCSRVKRNIPKMFKIFPCTKSTYPENFIKFRSRVFSVMLLTDKQTHKPTEMKQT